LPVESAVSVPRFGTFPPAEPGSDAVILQNLNWIDPRIPRGIVVAVEKRGLRLRREGIVDTGLGAVLDLRQPVLAGAVAPVPYVASAYVAPEK